MVGEVKMMENKKFSWVPLFVCAWWLMADCRGSDEEGDHRKPQPHSSTPPSDRSVDDGRPALKDGKESIFQPEEDWKKEARELMKRDDDRRKALAGGASNFL